MSSTDRSTVRRRTGLALWVAAALGVLAFGAGWLASLQGTLLEQDTDRAWEGERLHVVQVSDTAGRCVLTGAAGDERELTFTDAPPRGGFDPRDTQRQLVPGGFFLGAGDDPPGTLRCDDDVRVLSGAPALLPRAAEAGLWLVVPVALAFATGSALRLRPERTPPAPPPGPFLPG